MDKGQKIKIGVWAGMYLLAFVKLVNVGHTEPIARSKGIEDLEIRVQRLEEKPKVPDISVHGVMVGNIQSLCASNTLEAKESVSRGVFVFQPEVTIRRSERSEFFFKFGFAGGNGVAASSPFVLSPWAADTEDDLNNINGRNRDYLLTAYYTYELPLTAHRLAFTGGIIDATDFIDENAFANDEFSQFMNESLVNGANVFAPSYDLGGGVRFEGGPFSVNAVAMDVGENDDGRAFTFYGVQLGVKTATALGEGNFRIALEAADRNFLDVAGTSLNTRQGSIVSVDQEFGPLFGGWARVGTQSGDAAINYGNLYSGGLMVRGTLWGRSFDHVGIGHSYLNNGNTGVLHSDVTEAYARVQLAEGLALNLDSQYIRDSYDPGAGERTKGWISSLMVTTDF